MLALHHNGTFRCACRSAGRCCFAAHRQVVAELQPCWSFAVLFFPAAELVPLLHSSSLRASPPWEGWEEMGFQVTCMASDRAEATNSAAVVVPFAKEGRRIDLRPNKNKKKKLHCDT